MLTTYNHQDFVSDALQSVIEQSYQNIEIIIADDCSTDETITAIKPLLAKYKNKKIVTYCTGGIKCEKASALLLHEGFENVYQLHGGIIK